MSVVVGYPPNERGQGALKLGATLARSAGQTLIVAVVVATPWAPGRGRADSKDGDQARQSAEQALETARDQLPPDVTGEFVVHPARSVPSGLLQVAEQHQASSIVLGSSSAGMFGYVTLSSVADRLLHSSTVPVALATRGLRPGTDDRITRVTIAYGGSEKAATARQLVTAVQLVAAAMDASVRLASFAVQPPPPDTAMMLHESEAIMNEWEADIRATVQQVLAKQPDAQAWAGPLEVVVGRGRNWAEAIEDIEWDHEGELLVVGSSKYGPLTRVFLGSHATKIVRHSPVPVVVVPNAALLAAIPSPGTG